MESNKKKNVSLFKKRKSSVGARRDKWFYIALIAWPVLQFCIFYIGVNFKSFLLSFQSYSGSGFNFYFPENIFVNFERFFKNLQDYSMFKTMAVNSLIAYVARLLFGLTLGILVAYFIYKKGRGHKIFKVMIMMPAFISSLIFVSIFLNIVDSGLPKLLNLKQGLISNPNTSFATILSYGLWFSAGGSMLLYLNAMENIPSSLIDAAKIDGCNYFQELIYIVLPQIWQTFVVFFSVSIASYFTNSMGLYAFWDAHAYDHIQTIGYFFYVSTLKADYVDYPYLSSIGLLSTCIAVPVTLMIRNLMLKKGPRNE